MFRLLTRLTQLHQLETGIGSGHQAPLTLPWHGHEQVCLVAGRVFAIYIFSLQGFRLDSICARVISFTALRSQKKKMQPYCGMIDAVKHPGQLMAKQGGQIAAGSLLAKSLCGQQRSRSLFKTPTKPMKNCFQNVGAKKWQYSGWLEVGFGVPLTLWHLCLFALRPATNASQRNVQNGNFRPRRNCQAVCRFMQVHSFTEGILSMLLANKNDSDLIRLRTTKRYDIQSCANYFKKKYSPQGNGRVAN